MTSVIPTTGTIDLDRRTFEVGRGDWASDAAVGDDVILKIEVVAEAADRRTPDCWPADSRVGNSPRLMKQQAENRLSRA